MLDWAKQLVDESLIPLWSMWWKHRPSIPIATQVTGPKGGEYSEVLFDKHVHEHNMLDHKAGCHPAEERKISEKLVGHALV